MLKNSWFNGKLWSYLIHSTEILLLLLPTVAVAKVSVVVDTVVVVVFSMTNRDL